MNISPKEAHKYVFFFGILKLFAWQLNTNCNYFDMVLKCNLCSCETWKHVLVLTSLILKYLLCDFDEIRLIGDCVWTHWTVFLEHLCWFWLVSGLHCASASVFRVFLRNLVFVYYYESLCLFLSAKASCGGCFIKQVYQISQAYFS